MWFPVPFYWPALVSLVSVCSAEMYPNSKKLGWSMRTNGNWTRIWVDEMELDLCLSPHKPEMSAGSLIPFWPCIDCAWVVTMSRFHVTIWGAAGLEWGSKALNFKTAGKLCLLGSCEKANPRWDYVCKDFLRENAPVRKNREGPREGWESCPAVVKEQGREGWC